jgi:uncharacterized protein YecE (DUF72 family)
VFYPAGLVQRRELAYLAEKLDSVEINGSFYSLQRPSSYEKWAAATPANFVFAVKGSRFITHLKGLRDIDVALANFLASGLLALGPQLGPMLWQLPPTMSFDPDVLGAFLDRLPRSTTDAVALARGHDHRVPAPYLLTDAERPIRHALEVRHPSFATPRCTELLEKFGVALVVADTAGKFPLIEEITTDFGYLRLHGHEELYVSGYTDELLASWALKIRRWLRHGNVFVYFDNDTKAMAPRDALALKALLA